MHRQTFWLACTIVCPLALATCASPLVPTTGTPATGTAELGVRSETAGRSLAPRGPLRVTHHAPVGETDGQIEIAIAFDRQMVALGEAGPVEGVLSIEPKVALRVRWLGSQTLLARSAVPLPMATAFRVSLAAGLKALDGQSLAAPFSYTFSTPPPRVVRSEPEDGALHEVPSRSIELFFNQRVDPAQVQAHAKLAAKSSNSHENTLAFKASRPDPADTKRVRLTATGSLPGDSEVSLNLSPELRGDEGARPMGESYRLGFRVYGPLRLVSTDACVDSEGTCSTSGAGTLRFTNPVSAMAVRKALRFEPPLRKPLEIADYDYPSEYVYMGAELEPTTTYHVHIEGELQDVFGNPLTGARKVSLRTRQHTPLLYFPWDGEIVPSGSRAGIPLRLRNLPKVSVGMLRLGADEVEPLVTGRTWLPARGLTRKKLTGAGARDTRTLNLDATEALNSGKGVILVHATQNPTRPAATSARTILAFTDLSPTLKTWPRGGLVWVTQLSTATPVAGAKVSVVDCGKTVARGSTDADGSFRFARKEADGDCDTFAIVEKAGDLSYTRKYAGHGPWDLTSNPSYGGAGEFEGYLFTERGLYRPGERIRVKGVLQRLGERGLTAAQGQITLRATDSQEREIAKQELSLSAFGTFYHELRLSGSVPLGPVNISATLGKERFESVVEVAEYRRAELEAKLAPQHTSYVRGETAVLQVHATYLFGAPVSNRRVTWSARRTQAGHLPKGEGYEGFTFDDETRWFEDLVLAEETALSGGEGTLDAQGDLMLRVPLDVQLDAGSAGLEIEATVEGLGGVTTSTRAVLGVTPAAFLLGLKASTSLLAAGTPFEARVVAARLTGAPVVGAKATVRLTRRTYRSQLTTGDAGEAVTLQQHSDEQVATCELQTRRDAATCPLAAKAPGLHFLRVSGVDAKGRKMAAALPLYVYGAGEASWGENHTKVVTLKADRGLYRLGETARILVPSPFADAEAWISIERDGVLSVERKRLSGGAPTIAVNIDERFVPNAFVSVLLVRGQRPATASDDGRPDYRIGSVELKTDMSRRHLTVQVTPDATEKEPGQQAKLALQVRDGSGKPTAAELTVFAVDEGVLALSNYKTPDPFARMYAPRGLSVWTSDPRARLVKESMGEAEKGGSEGGGGGGGATLRRDFESVAFYAHEVLTDKQGKAEVKFKLPDSLTRYRLMAVAVSRSAELGSGEASLLTHKPLMVRPMLPRVIRVGDLVEAGAMVQTDSETPIAVEVRAEVSGLEVQGATKASLKVSKQKAAELRFKLRASQAGSARFRFTAVSGKRSDAFEVTRRVLAPTVLETVGTSGHADGQAMERLAALSDARSDTGGLEIALSTSALSSLDAPLRALVDYPYGCTEQLASRLLGLAVRARLVKLGVLEAGHETKEAQETMIAIERRQRADGSFALWDDDRGTRLLQLDAFLTGYALFALQQAELHGLLPSPQTRDDAKRWLSAYLRSEAQAPAGLADADRVFVLYALSRAGAPDKSYAGTFLERHEKLSLISRVELAHALLLAGDREGMGRVLDGVTDRLRLTADEAHLEENWGDDYETIMASDLRATAELVALLAQLNREHALLPRLARWLSNARQSSGAWGSTQENAWGLMALSDYLEEVEATPPHMRATAGLSGHPVLAAELTGRRAQAHTAIAMSALPRDGAGIDLARKGQGRLYYTLRLSYAKQKLPTAPLEQGMFLEREYERIEPVALSQGRTKGEFSAQAEVGDYVRVTLRVVVPATRRFLVIDDPLPAGLEPLNLGLATESQAAAVALGLESGPLDHTEIRDDRVVFAIGQLTPGLYRYSYLARAMTKGKFVVPPARVEEMYHPETFGRTAATQYEVVTR